MKEISREKLVYFLNSELLLSEFPRDESANGLQVEGREKVRRVGLAVDACDFVFEEALAHDIDFLIVHHGLIWGGIKSIQGVMRQRLRKLLDHDLSLYACHLPLDWHPEYGNNIQLLGLLSMKKKAEFGMYHGKRIGYWGRLPSEITLQAFQSIVDKRLDTNSSVNDFGRKVRNVGVVSGGGWSAITEADACGIDTFLTGEPSHSAYTLAEEMKVNLVFAGHYATETFGVKAVGAMLHKKFGLTVEFIDHPTKL